jgi:uncharacterized protein
VARLYVLRGGAKIPEDVVRIAEESKTRTAQVTGVGGVEGVRLGFFDRGQKRYQERDFSEFMELTSLVGNITEKDGKPFAHLHGTFGRRDLSVVGGHIVSASVFPLLEVVLTPTDNAGLRRFDEDMGLNVVFKTEG